MSMMGYVQNGVKRRKKRRNGAAKRTASVATKRNPAKRRTVGKATVQAYLKQNGLKAVSRSVANPKRKRRHHKKRRNGLATASGYISRRNGLFGNTKQDARVVGGVLGGAVLTKVASRFIVPFVAPYLAKVGAGSFTEIIVDGAIALVAVPMVAAKVGRPSDAQNARLGGLLVVAIDGIEMIAPNLLGYNPFNTSAVVIAGNQVAVAPGAVTKLVNGTSATPTEKAQVAGAMRELETGAMFASGGADGGMNRNQVLPMGLQ